MKLVLTIATVDSNNMLNYAQLMHTTWIAIEVYTHN